MQLEYHIALSDLTLVFSNHNNIIINKNRISRKGYNEWEICLLGDEMEEGIYRLNFHVYGTFLIGLVNSSKPLPSDGSNITEKHIGLFLKNIIIIIIICLIGIGIYQSLFLIKQ